MNRRRTSRVLVFGGLLLVLFALVAHAALRHWANARWTAAAARFEREVGSLNLASWELPPVALERNAATWISTGAAAVVLETGRGKSSVSEISAKPLARWNAEEAAAVRRAIDLNRQALEIIGRARSAEASSFGVDIRNGMEAKLPDLRQIIQAARLLHARATLALGDGRREEALADLILVGTIARSLEREHAPILVLVGAAVERMQLRLVHAFVEDPDTGAAELAQLEASLLQNDLRADYAQSFAAGGAAVCAAQRDESESSELAAMPALLRPLQPVIGPALAAACLDYYREFNSVLGRSRPEAEAMRADLERRLQSSWLTRGEAKIFLPDLINGASRMAATLALRRMAAVALEARAHASTALAYPTSLDGLASASAPDPLTGGVLRWQVETDGAAVLDLPGAEAIAAELYANVPSLDPWIWRLPAPR